MTAYRPLRDKGTDLLRVVKKAMWKTGYTFFGPDFNFEENVLEKGVDVSAIVSTGQRWALPLTNVQTFDSNACFFINAYAENTSRCQLILEGYAGEEWACSLQFDDAGYQLPKEISLGSFVRIDTLANTQMPGKPLRLSSIRNVEIAAGKAVPGKPVKLVLGQLAVYERSIDIQTVQGAFFSELDPKHYPFKAADFTFNRFGTSFPLLRFHLFRDLFAQTIYFGPASACTETELQQRTLDLICFVLAKYPYYHEHGIIKKDFLSDARGIASLHLPFQERLQKLERLIRTLHDGHFLLRLPQAEPKVVSGPVYVKEINGQIQVTGILQERLRQLLSLGAEVVAIDGTPVGESLLRYPGSTVGSSSSQRSQAVARLLFKKSTDSTTLTVRQGDTLKTVTYGYSAPVIIPAGFKPLHGEIRQYPSAVYLRLNRWDYGDWLRFYNHRETLQKSAALIVDLRGNTGGNEAEAFKFISTFIRRPITVSYSSYQTEGTQGLYADSNVIRPNPLFSLAGHRIVVLVDNSTACASEIFISAVKLHAGAVIVGSEHTMGSYASGEDFYLPFQIQMKANVLTKLVPAAFQKSFEYAGIKPDILVPLTAYGDLYPYNDKVLTNALNWLSRDEKAALNGPFNH